MTGGIIIDNFFKGVRLDILKEQLVNLRKQYKSLCYAINTAQSEKFNRSIKVPVDTRYFGVPDYLSFEDRINAIKEAKAKIFAIYMKDIGTPAEKICDNI